jgi:hypothetical protein
MNGHNLQKVEDHLKSLLNLSRKLDYYRCVNCKIIYYKSAYMGGLKGGALVSSASNNVNFSIDINFEIEDYTCNELILIGVL